ncbi:hypothetical protein GCM10009839_34630 [Catenulispora yoronensis]|uniref:F5/8 type C domain-containing protein n=1 Tax=Catenulispora yoronensis TaxID=450799 RepID=A0ABN2UAS8_9ACTN
MPIRPNHPNSPNSPITRPRLALVAAALAAAAVLPVAAPGRAHAAFASGDFLKTNGTVLRNASGTGGVVDLHGTNLGGWLTQEDWMSPLGEFALDRTGWTATASASAGTAGAALDGDATTGWSSGAAQAGGEWLQVDLGAPTQLDRVYVDAAANAGQYPAAYQVAVSSDGTTWSTVTSGAATAQRQSIAFPPRVARYLRVTQTGTGASPWTVAEINAFNDPVLTYAPSCLTAGNQVSGQTCVLDLGAQTSVWKVLFDAGAATPGQFPAEYEVWGSPDNTTWTKYTDGIGAGQVTTSTLPASQTFRYLKLVQVGTKSVPWSVTGVNIYSSPYFTKSGWTVTSSAGQWIQADMGSEQTFDQVQFTSSSATDYPGSYTVQVSDDGTAWTQVAAGSGYPLSTPINFPAVRARYFKLTESGAQTAALTIGKVDVALLGDDYDMNLTYNQRFGAATAQSVVDAHQSTWIQAADLDNIKALGLNMVRLPIGWQTLLNPDGTWKANAWDRIDWLVQQAGQRGIYVILDLHTLPGGDCPWASCGRQANSPNEFWSNTTYQNWVNTIWQQMAARYAGNPTVAAYDLMNEPLLAISETAADNAAKTAYQNRLYQTVRAADPDHVVIMEAFFSWSGTTKPATYGWTNVMYEVHPYDMADPLNADAQNSLVTNQLAALAAKQADATWGTPILAGEFQLYQYDDVWRRWLAGLNALNVSWSNWTYKVTQSQSDVGGGYWGLYNGDASPAPIINNDTAATVIAKLGAFGTANFQPNIPFQNDVAKVAAGAPMAQATPISQTGWTATASSSSATAPPSGALDWNTTTRWASGADQAPGQWFQVDMGTAQLVSAVSIESRATDLFDYPRGLAVQTSVDGTTWTTVRTGPGWGYKQNLAFAPVYARYLKLTQTSASSTWWTMAEFHAYTEPPLARSGWTATASGTGPGTTLAGPLDGSATSRWNSGAAQAPGQWYQVDMGKTQTFDTVLLDSAAFGGDYPRGYTIQTSADGTTWTTAATGTGSGQQVVSTFAPQTARYLRVTQTGTAANWWSIAELNVYGEQENARTGWAVTASATGSGSATANVLDGSGSTRWTGGAAQAAGQWVQLDMGGQQWFNHVVLDSGTSTNDYPRAFTVQVSTDATTWTTVANGFGTGAWTAVNFPFTQDRYVRVTLTQGTGTGGAWWSVAELRVFQ